MPQNTAAEFIEKHDLQFKGLDTYSLNKYHVYL